MKRVGRADISGKAARVAETEAGAEGIKIASGAHVFRPASIKAVPAPARNHCLRMSHAGVEAVRRGGREAEIIACYLM